MDPHTVYDLVLYKYVTIYAKAMGHQITNRKFKPSYITWTNLSLWNSAILLALYTAFTGTREVSLTNLYFALLGSQGLFKSYAILVRKKELQDLMDFLDELYDSNKNQNHNFENYRILWIFSSWNLRITKLILISFGFAFGLVITSPIPLYLLTNSVETIMPIQMPMVDTDTTWGYTIHTSYLAVLMTSAYFGTAVAELFMIMLTIHIWPMVEIFAESVRKFNKETTGKRQEAIKNSSWLQKNFQNLILMHIRIDSYVKIMSDVYYPVFTNEVYTDEASLIILVYVVVVLRWLPAVCFFILMFTKLLCYCAIGTAVEIMNDNLYAAILNIDCVMLRKRERKHLLLLIIKAQHPTRYRSGLVPLNLSTFINVMQTVYSFGMVLVKFA